VSGSEEEPSFSEEKEAKRLCQLGVPPLPGVRQLTKVFWFFFPKKNNFPDMQKSGETP
jgi:hypothetical protein